MRENAQAKAKEKEREKEKDKAKKIVTIGKTGHYARDCWSKGKGKGKSAFTLSDYMQELADWWSTEEEENWNWEYPAEEIQGQEGQEGQSLSLGSLEGRDTGLSLGGYLGHIKRNEMKKPKEKETC